MSVRKGPRKGQLWTNSQRTRFMTQKSLFTLAICITSVAVMSCSGKPDTRALRDSFAKQLAANQHVKEFQQNGDDLTFSAPGADGGAAKWRVHLDSATVDANKDEAKPYKGTVKSS